MNYGGAQSAPYFFRFFDYDGSADAGEEKRDKSNRHEDRQNTLYVFFFVCYKVYCKIKIFTIKIFISDYHEQTERGIFMENLQLFFCKKTNIVHKKAI